MMWKRAGCLLFLFTLLLLTSVTSLAQESTPTPASRVYTVVRGDNLYTIAQRFGTTVEAIVAANDVPNMSRILVGMTLVIPDPSTPTPVPVTPTETPVVVQPAESSAEEAPLVVRPAESSTEEAPVVVLPAESSTETPEPSGSLGFDAGGEVFGAIEQKVLNSAGMTWIKFAVRFNVGDTPDEIGRIVEQAHDAGFKVLLQISGSPEALATDGARYGRRFAEYLGAAAAFAPEAIEVWGAMNTETSMTALEYTQLLAISFQAIKIANPNTLVISGALGEAVVGECSTEGCDERSYLHSLSSAGVSQYADCIGIRYTLGALPPDAVSGDPRGEQFLYYYPAVVSVYANTFPDKPLCFTGIGYLVFGGTPPDSSYRWARDNTAENRAEWLARAALLARLSRRIRLFIVYNVNATVNQPDNPQADYAIVDADGSCLACLTLSTVLRQG
jgi:LysM repeat protein